MGISVILGDSISAGVGGSHPLAGYTARLFPSMVIARDGWTSRRLLKEVRKQPERMWKAAEDVLILIGGNDLIWGLPYLLSKKSRENALNRILRDYEKNLRSICSIIAPLIQGKLILVGLYNPLPHSDFARRAILQMNEVTRKTAAVYNGEFVDLFSPFEGRQADFIDHYNKGLLSDMRIFGANPVHPNDKGHQVIADTILAKIYSGISSRGTPLCKGNQKRSSSGKKTSKGSSLKKTVSLKSNKKRRSSHMKKGRVL